MWYGVGVEAGRVARSGDREEFERRGQGKGTRDAQVVEGRGGGGREEAYTPLMYHLYNGVWEW